MNPVRETVAKLIGRSRHVKINEAALKLFAQNYTPSLHQPYPLPKLKIDEQLNFLLLLGSLAFSFWGEPKWKIAYQNKVYDGYDAMSAALLRAIDKGENITGHSTLKEMNRSRFSEIFAGDGKLPLSAERLAIIHELGERLQTECEGKFSSLVTKARGSCIKLVDLLVGTFPTLEDKTTYDGETVYFRKRAQLIVYDLSKYFTKTFGKFSDVDELTAFADYKIPQLLRQLRIIEYDDTIAESIDKQLPIPPKSEDEAEIRMNTIWAVEQIVIQLRKRGIKTNPGETGTDLWHMSRQRTLDHHYHRTRTIAY